MELIHSLRNDASDKLEVHVEPWATPYEIKRGEQLDFRFQAENRKEGLVVTEVRAADWLALWFSCNDHPVVEIDGEEAHPLWSTSDTER